MTQPTALIASGFGIGLMPRAPGTWASLAALPCAWGLCWCCGTAGLAAATAVAFLAGWWASEQVARTSPVADPGWVVVDEIAGQWLVLLFVPQRVWFYGAAFAAFRLFDIWKPFPVSWCDRNVRGGLGIMLDDVAAAIYAAMLIAIAEGVAGVRP
ncbi:MAG: phosphatidylglycerophosphatase A [Alphaproteobacteria bacterium]|nr:phosphatidylglycerophosphatase A [Alphaproteobacteria bacterium]